ncbi:sensor domain-containing diguanylate cyclase [Bradyrhizobium sp. SRS-191]|uniref:sensor domain-containing diguanylate cyclase n=1 Tax=Bradyrhizobium sp. SRS-191 TaxID=2962606 RepID=UPI00211EA16E|nr:sensor domain-containing diguanylate cyclase [Bradyrhizobium sp. SRS-191]
MSAEHHDDARRLEALAELDILDTPRELAFDRLTGLCRKMFDVPMSTLTFIDGHRQWFKAAEGMAEQEGDRRPALCNYAIRQSEPLVIPDTHQDPRLDGNVLVYGKPFIRFYAGAQLRISGANVGTLCVMDTRPRAFGALEVEMLQDLAAIAVDELMLRNLSLRDSLTGALSRRAFRSEGERLRALAERHGHALTCALLDVDHFKSVNDTHGHGVGDVVLTKVVEACQNVLRASDVIGRLGGEEFGIVLPHTRLGDAMAVLEKMRSAVAALSIDSPSGPIRVTASFGVVDFTPGQPFDAMLERADQAMYAAKTNGRNQVIAWVDAAPSLAPTLRRVFKAGQIAFNAGRSTFDCTVRALSETAAALDVIATADVPEQFKLAIANDGFSRACRMTARSDKRVEVVFV